MSLPCPRDRIYAGNSHNLQFLFPSETPVLLTDTYSKKTLMRSPLIVAIYPRFRVSLSKPLSGLTSSSINDEDDQNLREPENDSYFGGELAEDDEMWDLSDPVDLPKPSSNPERPAHKTSSVEVLVRASSVVVEDVEYSLPAGVKSVVLIPHTSKVKSEFESEVPNSNSDLNPEGNNPEGNNPEGINPEDSLLISLLSGFSLLVRIWRVPRGFSDASFSQTSQNSPIYSHVFRPFVVQWWQLSDPEPNKSSKDFASSHPNSLPVPLETESGFSLAAHPSGLAVVSSSAHSLFRIHSCQLTPAGLQLSPQFNVPINGVLLNSCFAHPLNTSEASNHILFLTLTLSMSKRLELSLYSWYAHEPWEGNLETSILPLNNNFPFPIAIIPLANNNSFLLVCPEEFIIVTVNNIWSADYSFSRTAYKGSFPTAYSIPELPILSAEEDAVTSDLCDEVLIASDDGIIYSVIVQDNKTLECVPIIRVADPISIFDLYPEQEGYILTFSSDTGGAKKLYVPELYMQEEQKVPYTDATLRKDYKNWTPVVDVLVVDSVGTRNVESDCSQELWTLSGLGRRTKLSHISSGYLIRKESSIDENYRKAQTLFLFSRKNVGYVACCMPFETRFLDLETRQENLGLGSFFSGNFTLWCANITPEVVVQVSPAQVLITDFTTKRTVNLSIVFAKTIHEWVVLVCEENGFLNLQIRKVDVSAQDWFPLVYSVQVSAQVSALSVAETDDTLYVILGTFEGNCSCMALQKNDLSTRELFSIELVPYVQEKVVPHDMIFFPDSGQIFMGTKKGVFVSFHVQNHTVGSVKKLRLCSMPLRLILSHQDPNLLVVYARNIWLFNLYSSEVPSRVSFGEKSEKTVFSMLELPADKTDDPTHNQHIKLLFVKEDGLGVGALFTHKSAIIRQISIGEPAKKMAFLQPHGLFILLSKSKNPLTRIKFADRKNYKMLPTVEFDSRSGAQRKNPIFASDEFPTCCLIWKIIRGDRVSKKIIVGSSIEGKGGNLKILDVSKIVLDGTQSTIIKQVELISIPRDQAISCIEQIGSTILFSCGPCIYSTSYKLESKKLKPAHKLVSLSSDVTFMSVTQDSVLLVNSKLDSLLAFKYKEESVEREDQLDVVYKDNIPRSLVNNSALEQNYFAGDKLHSQMVIMDPQKDRSTCFKLSMIPRAYQARFSSMWTKPEDHIVAVGVNGEVVSFKPEHETQKESLDQTLAHKYGLTHETPMVELMERLARPFSQKVTGKGFHSLNKPYFDYFSNKKVFKKSTFGYLQSIVDHDLDELSAITDPGIGL